MAHSAHMTPLCYISNFQPQNLGSPRQNPGTTSDHLIHLITPNQIYSFPRNNISWWLWKAGKFYVTSNHQGTFYDTFCRNCSRSN